MKYRKPKTGNVWKTQTKRNLEEIVTNSNTRRNVTTYDSTLNLRSVDSASRHSIFVKCGSRPTW